MVLKITDGFMFDVYMRNECICFCVCAFVRAYMGVFECGCVHISTDIYININDFLSVCMCSPTKTHLQAHTYPLKHSHSNIFFHECIIVY